MAFYEKNIYCLYHANCMDGMTAAWALHGTYPNARLIPMSYGDAPPRMSPGGRVYLVDFSLPPEQLIELCSEHELVVVLDHHISAIRRIEGYEGKLPDNLVLILDTEQSGAMLTWRHLRPGQPVPSIVLHVEDRDLWRFHYAATRHYCRSLQSVPHTIEAYDRFVETPEYTILEKGRILCEEDSIMVDWHIKHTCREFTIAANLIPVVNVPKYLVSEATHELLKRYPEAPYVAGYHDTDEHRIFRITSRSPEVDVSKIAEIYGGGGHPTAAGFRVDREHYLAKT